MNELHPCRFGDGESIVRVELTEGCLCFPNDRVQDLCYHHYMKASPIGEMNVIICKIPDCPICEKDRKVG